MTLSATDRLQALQTILSVCRELWQPQPFREIRPAWCERWPALAAQVSSLSDDEGEHLNDDGSAARALLAAHVPAVAQLEALIALPPVQSHPLPVLRAHWDWEIPGRKRQQIEAFAAAVEASGRPVFDWCGGKGHLARLLALGWQVPATTLEINAILCSVGADLAQRARVRQAFVTADALQATTPLPTDAHVVALHACGGLHRQLLRRAAQSGVVALDLAPCCYHHGVETAYTPLSAAANLPLQRDDLRLAVTETVTAAPRIARRSAEEMAWKLGFVALRQQLTGAPYRSFKPVPRHWMRDDFAGFCRQMAEREGLPLPANPDWVAGEAAGWQRQRQVVRYSIIRHAFRRPLEIWMASDMAVFLEDAGYRVCLSEFCSRLLTPRNLLISARRRG